MKKMLSVLLVLSLLFSLTACNTTESSASSTDPTSSTGSTSPVDSTDPGTPALEDDIMTPYGAYPETVNITTARYYSPTTTWAPGESMEENVITKILEEELNVTFSIDWQVERTEFINKLSLNLAAGDIPDTFTLQGSDYLFYTELRNNDLLADLNSAYENCAGDYMKEVFATFEDTNLAPFREGDALYAIGSGNYAYGQSLFWTRQDWLDEVGMDVPMTVEELEALLRVFVDENIGGQGNLGMTLDAAEPIGKYASGYSANAIMHSFGAYPYQWLTDESGQVSYGSTAPEVKEGLALLARWYDEGLIDKQFMTRTSTGEKEALVNNGQIGAMFGWWGYAYTIREFPQLNPGVELVAAQSPLNANGEYSHLWPAPVQNMLVVSSSFEHPEALIKVLNVEYQGWRGIDPALKQRIDDVDPEDLYNASWADMFPTANLNLEYADIIPSVGRLAKEMIEEGTEVGSPTNTQHDRNMATLARDYANGTDPNGWVEYHTRYVGSNVAAESGTVVKNAYSYSTQSMPDLKPNLDKLELETYLKIITGEEPVEYFDEFVKMWNDQGGAVLTAEVQEIVDQMK